MICQSTAGKIAISFLQVLFCCLRLNSCLFARDVFIEQRGRGVMCTLVRIIAGLSMTMPQLWQGDSQILSPRMRWNSDSICWSDEVLCLQTTCGLREPGEATTRILRLLAAYPVIHPQARQSYQCQWREVARVNQILCAWVLDMTDGM